MSIRNKYLLKKYGITDEQYNELLGKQEGRCAVCKKDHRVFKSRLCVDHDHGTGHIRGLLCISCNRRIVGRHRLPNGPIILQAAADYLNSSYPGWVVPPKKKKRKKKRRVNIR